MMPEIQDNEFIIKNNNFRIREPVYSGNEEELIKHFENLQYKNDYTIVDKYPINCYENIKFECNKNKINLDEIIDNIGNINSPYVGTDGLNKKKFLKLLKSNNKFLFKITNIYNQIIENKDYELPKDWGYLLDVLRYKKNEASKPKNFRIISLINTTTKVFNRIVKYRIFNYLHANNLFNTDIQQGNIRNFNGLFTLNKRIDILRDVAIKNKYKIDVIFLDLKNAYGSVGLDDALFVLRYYKVGDWIINYIQKYYQSMEHNLMLKNKDNLKKIKFNFGLITGCSLSEGLFLIVMNYIFEKMIEKFGKNIFEQAYVDDICMFGYGEDLQDKLDYLEKLTSNFRMKFGIDKCRVKHLNKSTYKYKIKNEYIPELQKGEIFKYLGYIKNYNNNKEEHYQLIKLDFIKDIFERYNKLEDCKKYFSNNKKYSKEILDKCYQNYKNKNIMFFFMNNYKKYSNEHPYIIDLIIDFGEKLFGFENLIDKIKIWEQNKNLTYIKYGTNDKICNKYDSKFINYLTNVYTDEIKKEEEVQNINNSSSNHNNHGNYLSI